ncbi:MAG: hypothetical protein JWM68_1366 [Verrucomicrobiales bacterium]|nr:hypothetical protein [Verrucomicrobiales bacterium]
MNKPIQRVWAFRSDSNAEVEYQTLLYADGSTSCNCAGWTRRVASDGSRSCKHTRWVDMGAADYHCSGKHEYGKQKPKENHAKEIKSTNRLGRRKFAV